MIPKRYITQSSALQRSLSATVTDVLLHAEITLYLELCDRLSSGESESDDFSAWEKDWKIMRGKSLLSEVVDQR